MVINPELIAANEISRVFPFPSAIRVVSFSKRHVELLHHIWRKPLASYNPNKSECVPVR